MTTMARTHAEAREDFENVQEKKNVRDRYSPNRIHTLIVISKDKEKKYVKPKAVKMIALGFFALALVLSTARPVQAQDAKGPYPNMAPLDQYLMDRDAEIAMARSAAPEAISRDADVLVLGRHGYETAVKGKNGFVCLVERAWMGSFDGDKFWNPKVRGPVCYNPPAARSILPMTYKRTEMVLAGQSKAQILDGMQDICKARAATPGAWSHGLHDVERTVPYRCRPPQLDCPPDVLHATHGRCGLGCRSAPFSRDAESTVQGRSGTDRRYSWFPRAGGRMERRTQPRISNAN